VDHELDRPQASEENVQEAWPASSGGPQPRSSAIAGFWASTRVRLRADLFLPQTRPNSPPSTVSSTHYVPP